jgi:hypothetical protein
MQNKVASVNLEEGMPTAEQAVLRMKNALTTKKRQGCKAVILIHGYGSTGVGGTIRAAVHKALREGSLRGIVRVFAGGEQWAERKREMTAICKALEDHENHIAHNPGVTVVVLR